MFNLKHFLIVVAIVMVVFAVFFSLLLGVDKGLFPGLLIGLLVGSVISLSLGFLYSKSTKDLMFDWFKDISSRPARRKSLMRIIVSYLILLLGALFTRYTGQILLSSVLTIILSMTIYALYSYSLGEFKRSAQEGALFSYFIGIVTLLIPFTISYLIFLFVVYGFDLSRMKILF